MGNIKSMSEACKWAQLFACMPRSANCPGPLLNGMTLNRWLDGLEGVKLKELIYPGDEGCSDLFVKKKKEAICEACKWAQLFVCMPWSANCPEPLLNGITLNWWMDGLEGVKVKELIYPGDEGCSDLFVKKKKRGHK